jgi:hypothetical protein
MGDTLFNSKSLYKRRSERTLYNVERINNRYTRNMKAKEFEKNVLMFCVMGIFFILLIAKLTQ